jgi:hypothetical protein
MEFAYSDMTQSPSLFNGWVVAEEVNVGLGVGVSVIVGVNVTVRLSVGLCVAVGLTVGVSVGVKMTVGVADGRSVGVGVNVPGGAIKVDKSASRIRTPIRMGMPYFWSTAGSTGFFGSVGGSPV